MKPFAEIGRSGDRVTMRAFGATRYELVENASMAMFSIGRDLASIAPTYSRPLVAPGDTFVELLENWLDELLLLAIEEGIVWSQTTIDRMEVGGVQGSASGQYRPDVARHGPIAVGVAAVAPVVEIPDGYWVELTFGVDAGLRAV